MTLHSSESSDSTSGHRDHPQELAAPEEARETENHSPITNKSENQDDNLAAKTSNKSSLQNDKVPYSRFGRRQKLTLVLICASSGLFSTIAAPIYYPALTTIEKDFNVSEELANISVVVYFIFQGLSPTLMGGLADTFGRRPIVVWSIALYLAACIGLARAQTYGEILFLRCLQSAGISPVIAVNMGIMGDVTTKAERGGYMGLTAGTQILGSAFGALIGAGITATWDWRAIFWFLTIGSGISLMSSLFLLPETKRTIVGNGSIIPASVLNRAPITLLPSFKKRMHANNPDWETLAPPEKVKLLAPLEIMRCPEMALILLVAGLQFSLWTCQLTALSSVLEKEYHLTVAKVGLCYLPSGICTLISIVSAGRLLNWNYRRRFTKHEKWLLTVEKELLQEYDDDTTRVKHMIKTELRYKFNLFRARLEIVIIPLILSGGGFIAFGWCLDVHAPLATVLVFSGFASLFSNCIVACTTTLAVDLFPQRSSTASGCVNFARCILSAVFVASLSKMMKTMTIGGTFTFMACLTLASSALLWLPIKYGTALRYKRQQKIELREKEKAQSKEAQDLESQASTNNEDAISEDEGDLEIMRRISTAHSINV